LYNCQVVPELEPFFHIERCYFEVLPSAEILLSVRSNLICKAQIYLTGNTVLPAGIGVQGRA